LHAHIIPIIVKISLKRVEMNINPGSKNSIIGKTARYDRIINELCHFYTVSLIKTGLMFHKYHLLNQLQVFMRYKKITKMTFNIPLKQGTLWLKLFILFAMLVSIYRSDFYSASSLSQRS
jgi:hypothetical protein